MKAKAVHSMTEGPLARSIFVFSLPLMLSNVLQALFNMSDIAVVGRFAGADSEEALAGTCEKFIRRFRAVEEGAQTQGKEIGDLTLTEMTDLWNRAK